MKRIIKTSIALLLAAQLFSCAPNGLNVKATEIAKKFYTEYLKNDVAYNPTKAEKIKKKYMTDVMVEEIDLRTKEMEADAVTGVQDSTDMIKNMQVEEGEDEDWAKVTFDCFQEEGMEYKIYEIYLHFRDIGNRRWIDTLNMIVYDVDKDGDKSQTSYNTKYANKETLTEEDKAAMERIKKYYEELAEEGYIG